MQTKEILIDQGSSEWLSLRKEKIGSSDAPIIDEKSKWTTPYQLWCEKLSLAPSKEENEAMKRGKMLEPFAREQFEKITGIIVCPKVFVKDWQIASMDGVDLDNKLAVEIKCPGKIDHEMGMDGVVPDHYYPQLQHQMMVLDIPSMYYFTFNEQSNNVIEVQRDLMYCEKLLEKEKKFWNCLQTLESPSLTEKDYHERLDKEWHVKASQWRKINAQLKELEIYEDELRMDLIEMANGMNCKGAGVKISSSIRRGQVNYANIPELRQVDLEKYRKPKSLVWRLEKI